MKRIGDIMTPGGTYQGQDGEEKTRWMKCGVLLKGDRGYRIKLETVPVGGDGWLAVFEPRTDTQGQSQQKPAQNQAQGFRDTDQEDMPF
jgi:hypothetical protein